MADATPLTAALLREMFAYDPETGIFTHRSPGGRHGRLVGRPAGCLRSDGYVQLKVGTVFRKAHRLAWLYVTGEYPDRSVEIDHVDGDPSNNRWSNLRLATSGQNSQNTHGAHADSQTGMLGVSLYRGGPRYRARICVNGHTISLGVHATADEAHRAYVDAKRRLHEFGTL